MSEIKDESEHLQEVEMTREELANKAHEVQENMRKDIPNCLVDTENWNDNEKNKKNKKTRDVVSSYEDLEGDKKIIYGLKGLLTPKECETFITQTEQAGYEGIHKEYDPSYRSAQRLTFHSPEMAAILWNRIQNMLKDGDLNDLTPYGFGGYQGVWVPVGLNPLFRATRYSKSYDHFKYHVDGKFVKTDTDQSIMTVMFYLNDDFFNGYTYFSTLQDTKWTRWGKSYESYVVRPQQGMCLLFNHNISHSAKNLNKPGRTPYLHKNTSIYPEMHFDIDDENDNYEKKIKESFSKGEFDHWRNAKWIIRTDLMFRRIDEFYIDNSLAYRNDPNYKLAEKYYWESIKLQGLGLPTESTNAYLKAQELQLKFKVERNDEGRVVGPEYDFFSDFCFNRIFGHYMNVKDLVKVCGVSRAFNKRGNSNAVWRSQYLKRWDPSYCFSTDYPLFDKRYYTYHKSEGNIEERKKTYDKIKEITQFDTFYSSCDFESVSSESTNLSYNSLNSNLLPESLSINWKYSYKYRSNADKNFKPVAIYIGTDFTYVNQWNKQTTRFPSVVRPVCGHYWCYGSGEENCLVGIKALRLPNENPDFHFNDVVNRIFYILKDDDRSKKLEKLGEIEAKHTNFQINHEDDESWDDEDDPNKWIDGAPKGDATNMNWLTLRTIIKECLYYIEDKNDMTSEEKDNFERKFDLCHHNWTKLLEHRPIIIYRSNFMTDADVLALEKFILEELNAPYLWIVDKNNISNFDDSINQIIQKLDFDNIKQDNINRSKIYYDLKQLWLISQLPEGKKYFKTILSRINWTGWLD
tara:strand:+ start:16002 stop:18410 length:2409 start_codon:yes stop_codon:yes gene_type:complete